MLDAGWAPLQSKCCVRSNLSRLSIRPSSPNGHRSLLGTFNVRPRLAAESVSFFAEHEAWFREDTEVIDFFAPPRDDFLAGGKPHYMSEG
jgi:hypothetical protein